MDLTMKLKRLPIEISSEVVSQIKNNFNLEVENTKKEMSNSPRIVEEDNFEVDLDKTHSLSEEEYEKVTKLWSKGEEKEIKFEFIQDYFEHVIKNYSKNTALTFNDQTLTYEVLNHRINQLANYFTKNFEKNSNIVAIYMDRSLDMVIAIMAILKSGFAYLPLDPSSPKERVSDIVSDANPDWIVTNNHLKASVNEYHNVISLEEVNYVLEDKELLFNKRESNRTPNDLAYIIYTSGSTGKPKGVQITHHSLVNFIESINYNYEIKETDTILQFASVAFDVSVFDIFSSLSSGANLVIVNDDAKKSPDLLMQLMKEKKITLAELPPALLPLLDPDKLPDLRLISVGGEKFSGEFVEKWATNNRKFMNGYGPTETTVAVTLFDCKGHFKKNPPIGKPIHNTKAYVLNNKLEPLPIGIPGELCIGGKALSIGYLNNEKLTSEKFVLNPFEENEKIYKTGDLARWLPDGNLEILGRVDRQVKIRGFRIELEEIESLLINSSNVDQAIVEPFIDSYGNTTLVAYIVKKESTNLDVIQIKENISKKLPTYMVPSKFMVIESLPLTTNGKIDRKLLPAPDDTRLEDDNYVEPKNDIEYKICNEVLSPILGINKIGTADNFFDLGGNSIQATLVVSKIRSLFGIEINLIDFFQSPTAEAISITIEEKNKSTHNTRNDLLKELEVINESWLKIHSEKTAKFRLVCFPYAGSNGYIFKNWPKKLAPDIEVITIELPGHGKKIKEHPYDDAFEVANRLASELVAISDKPLIFLGHSGGAILAFETARILSEKGIKIKRLFPLVSRAPHVQLKDPPRYHLPKQEFLNRVNEFGGLSKEFLNNEQLLDVMIPVMRADEKLAETYIFKNDLTEINFPISVYGGTEDRVSENELLDWLEVNQNDFELKMFPGGHFFLQDMEDEVLFSVIESITSLPKQCQYSGQR